MIPRRFLIIVLIGMISNLGIILIATQLKKNKLKNIQSKQQELWNESLTLQKVFLTNQERLQKLTSTLYYYSQTKKNKDITRGSVSGTEGPKDKWVRYHHSYVFPGIELQFYGKNRNYSIGITNIKAWLISNDPALEDSYIYDSSVVRGDYEIYDLNCRSLGLNRIHFESFYLNNWITYYNDLPDDACIPYIHAYAREFFENGKIICTVTFIEHETSRVIKTVSASREL